MYSIDIIKSSIKLYFEFDKKNLIAKEIIKIINLVYDFHINTLYRCIDIYYNYDDNSIMLDKYNTNFT